MYLYGKNALTELLKSPQIGILKKVFLLQTVELSLEEAESIRVLKIPLAKIPLKTLEQLVGKDSTHQGVVMEIKDFQYSVYEELLEKTVSETQSSILFLDQIQDPHNFGAIIRTAYASGMHGIIICQDHSAQVTPAVIKVSAGSAFVMPICIVTNMRRALQLAQEKGYWIFGTDMEGKPYPDVTLPEKIGIVFGNEGEGIRRLVKETCDEMISIPMANPFNSLNVSVSAGVICFEILRRKYVSKVSSEEK